MLLRSGIIALFAVSCLGLCGCATDDSGKTNASGKPVDEQIKEIQARTDMPAPAKEMAIQQLKARQASAPQSQPGAAATPESKK